MKDTVQVSMVLPRLLWQQLQGQAQSTKVNESTLLIRAVEQFLQQESMRLAQNERLAQECEALAMMTFDDVGTEEEWLAIQNGALDGFVNALER